MGCATQLSARTALSTGTQEAGACGSVRVHVLLAGQPAIAVIAWSAIAPRTSISTRLRARTAVTSVDQQHELPAHATRLAHAMRVPTSAGLVA
jgi:hypothetical protein